MKRGRPPRGIERELAECAPLDMRVPEDQTNFGLIDMRVPEDRSKFALIEGTTHDEVREDELQRLREQHPPRVGSIYQAYVDFLAEYGHEPTKPRLKKWAIGRRYSDLPDVHDAKGWTRLWSNSGLSFLEPYPPTRCDPDLLKEMDSEGLF